MIRTVVVDDDYRVASIHAAYVGKVEGFEAIAEVHTAAAAVDAVIGLRARAAPAGSLPAGRARAGPGRPAARL